LRPPPIALPVTQEGWLEQRKRTGKQMRGVDLPDAGPGLSKWAYKDATHSGAWAPVLERTLQDAVHERYLALNHAVQLGRGQDNPKIPGPTLRAGGGAPQVQGPSVRFQALTEALQRLRPVKGDRR
jgi:hypothetical protein